MLTVYDREKETRPRTSKSSMLRKLQYRSNPATRIIPAIGKTVGETALDMIETQPRKRFRLIRLSLRITPIHENPQMTIESSRVLTTQPWPKFRIYTFDDALNRRKIPRISAEIPILEMQIPSLGRSPPRGSCQFRLNSGGNLGRGPLEFLPNSRPAALINNSARVSTRGSPNNCTLSC